MPSLLRSFLACECMETTSFLSTATIMKSLKPSVMKLDGLSKKTALPIGRYLSNSNSNSPPFQLLLEIGCVGFIGSAYVFPFLSVIGFCMDWNFSKLC